MYAAACAHVSKCRTPNVYLHTLRHTPSVVFYVLCFHVHVIHALLNLELCAHVDTPFSAAPYQAG